MHGSKCLIISLVLIILILVQTESARGYDINLTSASPSEKMARITFLTTSANQVSLLERTKEDLNLSKNINITAYLVSPDEPASYQNLNFSDQDVVMLVMLGYPIQDGIKDELMQAKDKGARIISYHFEDINNLGNVNISDQTYSNITKYWDWGGAENMERLAIFLGVKFCNLSMEILPPMPAPLYGIYHPDAPKIFEKTDEYIEWYNSSGKYNSSNVTVGVHAYSTPSNDTLPAADALLRLLEGKGANVIYATYTYKDQNSSKYFIKDNKSIVDALITLTSFRLHYGDEQAGIKYLEDLNVTPIKAVTSYYSSPEEWENSTGLGPGEISWQIALPELDGLTEFMYLSGDATDPISGLKYSKPVDLQVDWIAERAISWAKLHHLNNSQKKVAIIYYNHGGGKDNLGASYLDLAPSLKILLWAMNESGYRVEGDVPEQRDLLDLMISQGRNVGGWAPDELNKMVKKGKVELIPEEEYLDWFNDDRIIPPEKRAEVIKKWGEPPGNIMVYKNETERYIVIPKLSFGNVLLAPQPSRGDLENVSLLYHDKELPPHHQYIAFYLWLKKKFKADAVVHFGTHGTQEWLPGKETALSAKDCWPALLIKDLPVIYPYIMDNVGEGTQAKRRGNAVVVDHLTPPIVASGLYGNLSRLHQGIHQRLGSEDPLRSEIRKNITALYENLNLSEDVRVPTGDLRSLNETEFGGFLDELHSYLHELRDERIPFGLHILGEPPQGNDLISMVESMLGDKLADDVAAIYSGQPEPSAPENLTILDDLLFEVAINGSSPSNAQLKLLGNVSSEVSEDLNLSKTYAENLHRCEIEIPRVLDGLAGRYVPPRVGNDPIRNPDALPTGNNFYSFDPRLIPGEEAWNFGKQVADDLLNRSRKEHNGTYPRKVASVLWAVETIRHQGIMESQIFYLLGVQPVWDSKGRVEDVQLIPSKDLGRPRIDVVITSSGLYRDTFPDKIMLLDKAVRLAAQANDTGQPNYVKENSEAIYSWLVANGRNDSEARNLSQARIFSEAPGAYGTGLPNAIAASDTWENESKLADLFINRTGFVYSTDGWGLPEKETLRQNLAKVSAAVHSDSSNLIGIIDNDDFFQYLGGLGLAVRSVSGKNPDLYVTNLQDPKDLRTETLGSYMRRELSARYFNPKWIQGMQGHGYAGAREMDKFAENLWGWEATVPDLVTESMWNEVYDVYVRDKYDLGLKEFFDQNNPYAIQAMSKRMLETARKDRWHPNEEMKSELAKQYEQSVDEYGVTCCHHTCGNLLLQEYMQGVLPAPKSDKSSSSDSSESGASTHTSSSKHHHISDISGSSNQTRSGGVGTTTSNKPMESEPAGAKVEGFVMEAAKEERSMPSISGAPLMGIVLVLFMLALFWYGFRRKG